MAVPLGVNRSFFEDPWTSSGSSGSSSQGPAARWGGRTLRPLSREAADVSVWFRFLKLFQELTFRRRLRRQPRSERRRLSSGRPPGCQPTFFRTLADPRKFRIFWPGPASMVEGSQASRTLSARRSTSRSASASSGFSGTYVPSDPFVAARFRAEAAIYGWAGPPSTGSRKESRRPAECRTSTSDPSR